mmetsp:Transcript_6256/g.4720  ORF Transcript_6256/g.4720 Transcript_6256/m.4720 type:complete len:93 (+) Transcript_6256:31-309(+)
MLNRRIKYRRINSYRTKSNRIRPVKTPGGKLSVRYIQKKQGKRLPGLPRKTTQKFGRLTRTKRTVARAYGGVLSHADVRERITRAFLIEEVK